MPYTQIKMLECCHFEGIIIFSRLITHLSPILKSRFNVYEMWLGQVDMEAEFKSIYQIGSTCKLNQLYYRVQRGKQRQVHQAKG